MKFLDLENTPSTTHIEIIKRLIDEITLEEKRVLLKYLKTTMKPPTPQPQQPSNLVSFK